MAQPDAEPTIVIVEDDALQRGAIAHYLQREGLRVHEAGDGAEMWRLLDAHAVDLVLLDVRLPGDDGFSIARRLRERVPAIGIVMVTAKQDTVDRVVGLETGADDYVVKPFDPRELLARVRSVLRRSVRVPVAAAPAGAAATTATVTRVRMGRWLLDLAAHQLCTDDGRTEALTATEFDLLRVFAEHPDRPLTREWLLQVTSHRDLDPFDRSIDLRITRLRRKLETDPQKPSVLRTVRGVGYLFNTRHVDEPPAAR